MRDPDLKEKYRDVIEDYVENRYAAKIPEENKNGECEGKIANYGICLTIRY